MASTSRQSIPTWKYDVFLSFRGKDTRKSFCGHLFAALDQKGIFTFKDNHRLEKGSEIQSELLKAIEESMFSVVVISENYASSVWCLDELDKIMESKKLIGQTVLPIFYNVSPSEVRNQSGSFQKAFAEHEEKFKNDTKRLCKWRIAMTEIATLSGWPIIDREESEVIRDIVNEISSKVSHTFLSESGKLVGIDSRLQQILFMLGTSSKDVRMIGICGMGGIGKTTLARVVFNRISNQFDGGCFLANIREVSMIQGLVALQEQLVSEISIDENIKIWNVESGCHEICKRFRHKRVLVILDDVDDSKQLGALAAEHDWFGLGSRIIITTRDQHPVRQRVDEIYMAEKLNDDEALQLFSWNAFRKSHPTDDYFSLSYSMVIYADGLPLALEVLGSFLFGRGKAEWKHALGRLREIPNKKIFEILKISYDGLQETEKKIFLDIACFFKGKDKDQVREFLDCCNFYPDIGISVLIDKCIITLSNNKLHMHDLIQDMGREIVRQESPNQPGQRSRLWRSQDICRVLPENGGTEAVEGIKLCFSPENMGSLPSFRGLKLKAECFFTMKNLRFLNLSGKCSGPIAYLPNELRLLKWTDCPLTSLPSNFHPENLYKLSLCHSHLQKLWKGAQNMSRLKIIKLSNTVCLTKTPNFTAVQNLERLVLDGCTGLLFLHPSVGLLERLNLLSLKDCKRLRNLPTQIKWESLEVLILSGCSNLENIEHVVGNSKHLLQLLLDGTSIKEVPPSIQYLTRLTMLNLKSCKSLVSLPNSICELRSLKLLNLNGCSKLKMVPDGLGHISSLEKLDFGGTSIRGPPSSVVLLENLEELSFHGCKGQHYNSWTSIFQSRLFPRAYKHPIGFSPPCLLGLCSLKRLDLGDCNLQEGIVTDICLLSSLESLILSRNDFFSLPATINRLSKLENLNVDNCKNLRALPELPLGLNRLFAHGCRSLESFVFPSYMTTSTSLLFNFSNCFELARWQGRNGTPITFFNYLLQLPLQSQHQGLEHTVTYSKFEIFIPGSRVPEWFTCCSRGSSITTSPTAVFTRNPLRGLAFCVVFSTHHSESSFGYVDDPLNLYIYREYVLGKRCPEAGPFSIYFSKGKEHPPLSLSFCASSEAGQHSTSICTRIKAAPNLLESDHVWLCYVSKSYFSHILSQDDPDLMTAVFIHTPGLWVKECGLHPVYWS